MQFPETIWARIRQAGESKTTAVHEFVTSYQRPVKRYLLMRGIREKDAEDIVQEVFMIIFEHDLLRSADETKGKFRSYILGITKNVLANAGRKAHAEKRGGDAAQVSLDQPVSPQSETSLAEIIAAQEDDATFDSLWMDNVISRALTKLKSENAIYFQAISLLLENRGISYDDLAKRMNCSFDQVKNYVHRGKKKLIQNIRDEIAGYCSSPEDLQREIKYLSQFLNYGR